MSPWSNLFEEKGSGCLHSPLTSKGVGVLPFKFEDQCGLAGSRRRRGNDERALSVQLVNEKLLASYGRPEDFRAHLTVMHVKGGAQRRGALPRVRPEVRRGGGWECPVQRVPVEEECPHPCGSALQRLSRVPPRVSLMDLGEGSHCQGEGRGRRRSVKRRRVVAIAVEKVVRLSSGRALEGKGTR